MYLVVFGLLCAFIGRAIGAKKDAVKQVFVLGLLLGPIGLVIAALIDGRSPCPTCGTNLNGHPTLCPSCHTRFSWDDNSLSMVKKIKNKSMLTAVISRALAITSIASTLLIGVFLTVNVGLSMALNAFSPIIILAALIVAIKGLFFKGANMEAQLALIEKEKFNGVDLFKGANMEARSLCVFAILTVAISVCFYIIINSINGIV